MRSLALGARTSASSGGSSPMRHDGWPERADPMRTALRYSTASGRYVAWLAAAITLQVIAACKRPGAHATAWIASAAGSVACRASWECSVWGRCTAEGDECVAASAADCEQLCQRFGLCSPGRWGCGARTDEECQKPEPPKRGVRSDPYSTKRDDDCRCTEGCQVRGQCSARYGTCAWGTDDDCRRSPMCAWSGLCFFNDGKCIAGFDDDCRQSQECLTSGRCVLAGEACRPGSEEDCELSLECAHAARCSLVGGRCVATSAKACFDSDMCISAGQCTLINGGCVAASDADCEQSMGCITSGHCDAIGYTCRNKDNPDE
jgi:hypothetical protein